ncbi:unnamed protein product [Amoebophrya sp. A120]|nr:unnamed protein product [Amoebophrya sp. A120]|eukprot:GSA120T00007474001.1
MFTSRRASTAAATVVPQHPNEATAPGETSSATAGPKPKWVPQRQDSGLNFLGVLPTAKGGGLGFWRVPLPSRRTSTIPTAANNFSRRASAMGNLTSRRASQDQTQFTRPIEETIVETSTSLTDTVETSLNNKNIIRGGTNATDSKRSCGSVDEEEEEDIEKADGYNYGEKQTEHSTAALQDQHARMNAASASSSSAAAKLQQKKPPAAKPRRVSIFDDWANPVESTMVKQMRSHSVVLDKSEFMKQYLQEQQQENKAQSGEKNTQMTNPLQIDDSDLLTCEPVEVDQADGNTVDQDIIVLPLFENGANLWGRRQSQTGAFSGFVPRCNCRNGIHTCMSPRSTTATTAVGTVVPSTQQSVFNSQYVSRRGSDWKDSARPSGMLDKSIVPSPENELHISVLKAGVELTNNKSPHFAPFSPPDPCSPGGGPQAVDFQIATTSSGILGTAGLHHQEDGTTAAASLGGSLVFTGEMIDSTSTGMSNSRTHLLQQATSGTTTTGAAIAAATAGSGPSTTNSSFGAIAVSPAANPFNNLAPAASGLHQVQDHHINFATATTGVNVNQGQTSIQPKFGLANSSSSNPAEMVAGIEAIQAKDLYQKLLDPNANNYSDVVVIDVRGRDHEGGHIPDSIWIKTNDVIANPGFLMAEIRARKVRSVVFTCMYSVLRARRCCTALSDYQQKERLESKHAAYMIKIQILAGGFHGWVNYFLNNKMISLPTETTGMKNAPAAPSTGGAAGATHDEQQAPTSASEDLLSGKTTTTLFVEDFKRECWTKATKDIGESLGYVHVMDALWSEAGQKKLIKNLEEELEKCAREKLGAQLQMLSDERGCGGGGSENEEDGKEEAEGGPAGEGDGAASGAGNKTGEILV